MVGLLESLGFGNQGGGGGLLDFLRQNAMQQPMNDPTQPYNAMPQSQPNWMQANAQVVPQQPPIMAQRVMPPIMAQSAQQPPAPITGAQPLLAPQEAPSGLSGALGGFLRNISSGPVGALIGAAGGAAGLQDAPDRAAIAHANATANYLRSKGIPEADIAAAVGDGRVPGQPEVLKHLVEGTKPQPLMNIGSGNLYDPNTRKTIKAYEADDKTPSSVLEYQYYTKNFQPTPDQQRPMPYDVWSTAKSRAGATNISNNIDMNSGQTYDKQLAEGLGKSHASLANGVEDAQTRARDIAAMQGAIDAIQKNGGTTGGLGQQQILDLKKTINNGANAVGIDKPFNEGDLSDKEFLTKFNRSMAGAQAKNAVGSRVTNFEMSNFLKANPGIDMSITGNQRLLGIQAQMEDRNISVGNAIRDATAEAISQGKKINPVQVQKIIADHDRQNHIKDPVTGQNLTQSYALPEFQKSETNASMAQSHTENLKSMEKTIGGKTYVQRNGQWFVK